MAKNLAVGMSVFVPVAKIGNFSWQSALYRTTVRQIVNRSVEVDVPGGGTATVASSAVHTDVGVLIVRVGDFSTEDTLLDPMAKSLLQYSRLLLTDDMVRLLEVRTTQELRSFWEKEHANFACVVLAGHGSPQSLVFAIDGSVSAENLAAVLDAPQGVAPKVLMSLACRTGQAGFAKRLSCATSCRAFVAPFHSVHGAIASQFSQTLLAYLMLEGKTIAVAYRHARKSVPGTVSFRLWQNGALKTK